MFAAVTLLTGSLWGRPTWGTYWTWDARLTSTAVLTALLVGYLALRRLDLDPDARSTRAAVLGLLLVPNVDRGEPLGRVVAVPAPGVDARAARPHHRGRHAGRR